MNGVVIVTGKATAVPAARAAAQASKERRIECMASSRDGLQ